MKEKERKRKKLRLNKETVRKLQDDDLKKVVGGTVATFPGCGPVTAPPICACLGTTLPAPTGFNDCF